MSVNKLKYLLGNSVLLWTAEENLFKHEFSFSILMRLAGKKLLTFSPEAPTCLLPPKIHNILDTTLHSGSI